MWLPKTVYERVPQYEAAEAAKAKQQSANEMAQGASLPAA